MAAQQECGNSSFVASAGTGLAIGSRMQECQCTSEQVRTHTVISGSSNPVWHTGVLAPFAHLVLHLDYNNHRHIRIQVSNDDGSTAKATTLHNTSHTQNENTDAPNVSGASALALFSTSAILATADLSLHDLELPKYGEVDLISGSSGHGTAAVSTSNGIYDFAGASVLHTVCELNEVVPRPMFNVRRAAGGMVYTHFTLRDLYLVFCVPYTLRKCCV